MNRFVKPAIHAAIATGIAAFGIMASSAHATTIDVSSSFDNSGGNPFWTRTTNFNLPVGFSNARLNITHFTADDRAVAQLNGALIDAAGIFGPGNGEFHLTATGPNNPFFFVRGNGARNIDVSTGFVAGLNTLNFIINDTFTGISGVLTGGGRAGPTAYFFNGTVSFDPAGSGVPEPASWALMIAGFGLVGSAMRRRPQLSLRHV